MSLARYLRDRRALLLGMGTGMASAGAVLAALWISWQAIAFVEVILALSSDVEGRATAVYLAELLRDSPVRVTRPALGLPAGANLSYADAATIGAAFSGRSELD